MVKGQHLQLRCHPSLFHKFKQFNIKVAVAHYTAIKKEVDEHLAKGAIEPLTSGAVSTQVYLCFLNVEVHNLILNDLIATCTYLL